MPERDLVKTGIAGLDDIWEGQYDLTAALHGLPPDIPVVIMVHEPNFAAFVADDGRADLQLSGHSHGGQIRAESDGVGKGSRFIVRLPAASS